MWSAAVAESTVAVPASANCRRVAGSSSHSVAVTPSALSAAKTARPVTPPPATSTGAAADSGSSAGSRLTSAAAGGGQPLAVKQRHPQAAADRGEQPEPDDHGGFGPADQLEMVVERRHPEHPPSSRAEGQDLHHHRDDLRDEQRAQHHR